MRQQKTFYQKPEQTQNNWVVLDASDQVLGRLASKAARIIRGKDKPEYTPAVDTGDSVIIINSDKVRVTGNKETDKMYHRHSGYPGGLTSQSFKELMKKDSRQVIEKAVHGMLPHNRLGRRLVHKLKVYTGPDHPHQGQVNGGQD